MGATKRPKSSKSRQKKSKASPLDGSKLLKLARGGDVQAFAQFLTWQERTPAAEVLALKELIKPARMAFRFGITGPPGAGKSTLVGRLIHLLRAKNLKIGVIAVDPSSPFTKGAILGDRIRYSEHTLDSGVFIRSLGTRGSLGGLSAAAFLMARAFDAAQFDVLLIETVGVGQTELDVLHVADQVCVVLVPESGDSIQAMKAGLMEIADVFVVNKADRPGADGLAREIEAAVHDGGKEVQVLKSVASEGRGVDQLARLILESKQKDFMSKRNLPKRIQEEARTLLRQKWERQMDKKLGRIQSPQDLIKSLKS